MTLISSIESHQATGHRTAFSAVGIPASEQLDQIGNHRWRPAADVSLSLEDLGSLQGATLVERLRTVNLRALDVEEHLDRLKQSGQALGIQWPSYLTVELVNECVARNLSVHAADDFNLVILMTPGLIRSPSLGSAPTVIIHTADLNWKQLAFWYEQGQPLVIAPNRNVPVQCWSPHMKTRSRMHYYLADQHANSSSLPHAGAVMLSLDGFVTESSVANILLIDGDHLVSPPLDSVLHGLSLRRTIRLAEELKIPIRYENVSVSAACQADALLLTGSSGCLWPASQFVSEQDVRIFEKPTEHSLYMQLRAAWVDELGIDYTAQAIEHAARPRA